MQLCDVTVRLQGDVRFQVPRQGITPAEILVLRHVQGAEDAVSDIVLTGTVERNMHEEMARLAAFYGDRKVKELFPGVSPRIPTTLEEIGVTPKAIAGEKVPEPRRRGRPAAQEVKPAATATEVRLPSGGAQRTISAEEAEKRDAADTGDATDEDGPATDAMP